MILVAEYIKLWQTANSWLEKEATLFRQTKIHATLEIKGKYVWNLCSYMANTINSICEITKHMCNCYNYESL